MKKLIFTTLGLFAFAGVGMAKNVDVKVKPSVVSKITIADRQVEDKKTPCDAGWVQAYIDAGANGLSSIAAADAWAVAHNC